MKANNEIICDGFSIRKSTNSDTNLKILCVMLSLSHVEIKNMTRNMAIISIDVENAMGYSYHTTQPARTRLCALQILLDPLFTFISILCIFSAN